jgi:hypothetical protein
VTTVVIRAGDELAKSRKAWSAERCNVDVIVGVKGGEVVGHLWERKCNGPDDVENRHEEGWVVNRDVCLFFV